MRVHVRKYTAYFVKEGNNRHLVKQDNAGFIFCMPAIQEGNVVVICDLEKKEEKFKNMLNK